MMTRIFPAAFVGLMSVVLLGAVRADDARDEAIRKDRQKIAGTWQVVAVEINGERLKAADVEKLTVINDGDGLWSLRDESREIARGDGKIDPQQSPKTIDFIQTDGEGAGKQYLGIYEVGDTTRKLCFAPADEGRPDAFTTMKGSGRIYVELRRLPKP